MEQEGAIIKSSPKHPQVEPQKWAKYWQRLSQHRYPEVWSKIYVCIHENYYKFKVEKI